jgi:hypothetical protein
MLVLLYVRIFVIMFVVISSEMEPPPPNSGRGKGLTASIQWERELTFQKVVLGGASVNTILSLSPSHNLTLSLMVNLMLTLSLSKMLSIMRRKR